MKKLLWTLSLIYSIGSPLIAAIIYSPGNNTQNSIPFSYGPMASLRVQQVYGAADFSAIGAGGGLITSFAFEFADSHTFGGGVSNVQINLSTTSRTVDGLSPTFAQNIGLDDKVVFGPSAISWNNFGGYSAVFNLTSPFFYNPANGNLLMDMRVYQSGFPELGMGSMDMRASDSASDRGSRVYAFNVNNLTGAADTIGLGTQFTVTPVPEPGTWAMLLLGMPAIFFAVYRKTTKHQQKGKAWH